MIAVEKLEYIFRYLVNTHSGDLSTGKFKNTKKSFEIREPYQNRVKTGVFRCGYGVCNRSNRYDSIRLIDGTFKSQREEDAIYLI